MSAFANFKFYAEDVRYCFGRRVSRTNFDSTYTCIIRKDTVVEINRHSNALDCIVTIVINGRTENRVTPMCPARIMKALGDNFEADLDNIK